MRYIISHIDDRLIAGLAVANYQPRAGEYIIETSEQPVHLINIWNGSTFIEGATLEQLQAASEQARDNAIREFMQRKEQDGKAYADAMRFEITKELIGKPIATVNEIDGQTKVTVMPLLELIENKGDYWTAMNLAMTIAPPTNAIALCYFNDLKGYIINYVQTNYPTD
jgi:hypothetical protein